MTELELFTLLQELKIAVAYDHFIDKQPVPFIVYRNAENVIFYADDKAYFLDNQFEVVLVTAFKDLELENDLEALFDENNISFQKEEYFNDAERVYQITYTI